MLNKADLVEGKVYQIAITGMIAKHIGVAKGRDTKYGQPMVEVLDHGMMHGVLLRREDYIPLELFADSVDDPKVAEVVAASAPAPVEG